MPAPVASTPVMFGRLPTVLVPGLLCTPQLFMAQLPLFWTQGSVTVADTTRHGEIGAMARAILADAPPVFRLVGLSMGGYLAFEILRQAPERVGELVLFDTSARADTDEVRENRLQMIRMAQNGGFGRIPSMFPRLVAPGRVDDLQLAARWRACARRSAPRGSCASRWPSWVARIPGRSWPRSTAARWSWWVRAISSPRRPWRRKSLPACPAQSWPSFRGLATGADGAARGRQCRAAALAVPGLSPA
ncbi:alpha/beta hydrolase [Lautropia mirabilis]